MNVRPSKKRNPRPSTTLLLPRVSAVLERLLADSDRNARERARRLRRLNPAQRAANHRLLMQNPQKFYAEAREDYLAIGPDFGNVLYVLARILKARRIVEFGASFGISTLFMAAALRDNGGGRLITTEFEPSKAARARENLAAAGLDDLVEIREGDAMQTLRGLRSTVDLLLLDGSKSLYVPLLKLLEPSLAPGSAVAADNTTLVPEYLDYVRNPAHGYFSADLKTQGGNEISLRV